MFTIHDQVMWHIPLFFTVLPALQFSDYIRQVIFLLLLVGIYTEIFLLGPFFSFVQFLVSDSFATVSYKANGTSPMHNVSWDHSFL